MIIGFTGTRQGMTEHQRRCVRSLLSRPGVSAGHHGDCIGADADFHELCVELGIPVVIHPPVSDKARAFLVPTATEIRRPRPYRDRNRQIVRECGLLVATPKEYDEPPPARGQGTWMTVRFARKMDRRTIIIPPYPAIA